MPSATTTAPPVPLSTPITASRFSDALTTLPLSALYAKAAELRNSIAHLQRSNAELEDYIRAHDADADADDNDRECYEALLENKDVVARFAERIALVRREVEDVRGLPWREQGVDEEGGVGAAKEGAEGAGAADGVAQGQSSGTAVESNGHERQPSSDGVPATEQVDDGVFL